jgi:hypothetical protein
MAWIVGRYLVSDANTLGQEASKNLRLFLNRCSVSESSLPSLICNY